MFRRTAFAAFLLLSTAACHSKVTGYNGNFTIAYASGVDVENFVKPIAPGAKLEVVAFANGTDDELTIVKATSSRPSIVAIDEVGSRSLVLRGGEPGVSDVEITAKDPAGKTVVDKMFFHVAKPSSHGLEHACTEEDTATYVVGDHVDLFHSMKTSDNRAVVGVGIAPFEIKPANALRLVAQPQGANLYRFEARTPVERVTVRSTIDAKALTLRLVDKKELTDARLFVADTLIEGQGGYALARVRFGEAPLCTQRALTKARSLTPDICKVSAKLDDDASGDSNREQLAVIDALKFGNCEFEMTLPELAQGKGIVLRGKTKVGRLELPGDRGTEKPFAAIGGGLAALAALGAWLKLRRGALSHGLLAIARWLVRR